MPVTRVFSDVWLAVGEAVRLPEEEAHHVYKVLRAQTGDRVEVVDSGGRLFVAELSGGREAKALEELPAGKDEGEVTLYQAVPKGRHMDLVVEKVTEIGVGRIIPLVTERGVVRVSRGGDGKIGRWRRVASAAARQSLRLRVPEVSEPVALAEAVREAGESGVMLHNEASLPPLEDVVAERPVSLFVGPEGGWSKDELERSRTAGLRFASLGPFRLRSETAGVAAATRACAALERAKSVARS